MIEGIAGYSSTASQVKLAADTNVAVAKKVFDHAELEGQAVVALLDSTSKVGKQAAPTGDHTGQSVNRYA